MSDKDLIKRSDVYEAIYALHADGKEGIMNAPRNSYGEDLRDVIDAIGDIPAVPQEMSAREYEETFVRMRHVQPMPEELYLAEKAIANYQARKAVAIVEKWAREHPERNEE